LMFFPFIFVAYGAISDIGGITRLAELLPADKAEYWAGDTPFGAMPIMLFGIFFMGMSYWSTEAQVIQRPLASKSEEDSIISYLGATFWFSILVPLLVTLPALCAIHYFPGLEKNDHAMPMLIRKVLPRGLYGVTVVGLMAGVFSSVEAQINSFCTMFTTDIYRRVLVPNRDERHYLVASKIAGVAFALAAIGTAVVFSFAKEGMMLFAISVLATIMPPFAAVTILGAMIRWINKSGAMAGLICSAAVAIGMVVVDNLGWLRGIADETLYFRTMVTFLTGVVVTIAVSAATGGAETQAQAKPASLDLSLRWSPRVIRMAVVLTVGMACMVGLWTYYF
jgi:SSS family solute:Na+ symporter